MSRRGSTSPPITLFSFQDIITSVTGIFILMTLLLALQLTMRKPGRNGHETTKAVESLRRELAQTEEEIRQIEKRVQTSTKDITEQAAASPERLARESAALELQLDRYRKEVQKMRAKKERSVAELRKIENDVSDQEDRQRLQGQEAIIRSSQAQLERLRTGNWLVYRSPPGFQKQAWLVDIAAERFLVAPLGGRTKLNRFEAGSFFRPSGFETWVRSRDKETEYFVLLVRPSGIRTFDSTRDMLESLGFDIGYDLIGADQTIIPVGAVTDNKTID